VGFKYCVRKGMFNEQILNKYIIVLAHFTII
jgi:hypothetical protein